MGGCGVLQDSTVVYSMALWLLVLLCAAVRLTGLDLAGVTAKQHMLCVYACAVSDALHMGCCVTSSLSLRHCQVLPQVDVGYKAYMQPPWTTGQLFQLLASSKTSWILLFALPG